MNYQQLRTDLLPFLHLLGQASDAIVDQDVSSYPVFVVFQTGETVALGLPLIDKEDSWTINASTLEELVSRQVINMERVDRFRQVFKAPERYLCLLVWQDGEARFIFMPRQGVEEEE